ncbi:hypothetical protein ACFL6P_06205, partial [Candidatus Latescibacterota bacterium]
MNFRKTTLILVAAACLLAFTGTSIYAQGMMKGYGMKGAKGGGGYGMKNGTGNEYGMNGMRDGSGKGLGLIGILEAANDPLTDEQITQLKEIEGGIEAHDERMAILTESQIAALEAFKEEHPGKMSKQGRKGKGRGLGIIGILKIAGDPLTDEQIALLQEIEGGIEVHDER